MMTVSEYVCVYGVWAYSLNLATEGIDTGDSERILHVGGGGAKRNSTPWRLNTAPIRGGGGGGVSSVYRETERGQHQEQRTK